jgi:hypothetical protein
MEGGTNAMFKRVCATLLLVALCSASVPGSAIAEDLLLLRESQQSEVDGEPDFPTVTVTRRATEPPSIGASRRAAAQACSRLSDHLRRLGLMLANPLD